MQNLTRILSVMALASGALLSTPAMAEIKIASIRLGEVFQQSPTIKAGGEKLKAEFERKKNELEAEGKRLYDDSEKFKKERDLLSSADRSKREKDLANRNVEFQQKQRQAQEDLAGRERQMFTDAQAKVDVIIQQLVKEKQLDLIVRDPVWATPAVDITDEVVKRLGTGGAAK